MCMGVSPLTQKKRYVWKRKYIFKYSAISIIITEIILMLDYHKSQQVFSPLESTAVLFLKYTFEKCHDPVYDSNYKQL